MDDKELGRLLRMSQGNPTAAQQVVLASHFGIVAAELYGARQSLKQAEEKLTMISALISFDGSELSFRIREVLDRDQ
jgi:hypothetical protein